MDSSKPYVRLSVAQDTTNSEASNPQHNLAVSTSGSLPIRARLTLDSDSDSDSELSGAHELGYITTSSNISENEEEFETASERPFLAAESSEDSGYEVFWPSVSDPDEYEGVVGKVMVGGSSSEEVRPIANVSWESDGSDVVSGDEGEGGGLLGHVKALVSGFLEQVSVVPRVKVSEVDEEEEDETLEVEEINFVEGGNRDSVGVECVEDCGYATAESSEANSVELNVNVNVNVNVSEGGDKDEYVEEESFVHESLEKLEEIDVEGDENQGFGYSHMSDVGEDKVECSASFNAITPRSVLGGNVATALEIEDPIAGGNEEVFVFTGVQFQGNEAKVEVPLMGKDCSHCTMEQNPTSLGLFGDSVPHVITVIEVKEEEELVMGKDSSNSFVKESEPSTEVKGGENSDLEAIVKGETGESFQAEWTEDNGLGGVETKEPETLEEAESMAEESIMHCPKSKASDVDLIRSSGALDRGLHSECDFDVEGNGSQIIDLNTYSQPSPILKIVYLGNRNLSEAADGVGFVLCSAFFELITPSSSVIDGHFFGGETKVRNCKIGRRFAGVTVNHLGEDATAGLKIEDQIAIGKGLVLAGSAGAVQCQGDTACGAKLELCLKEKNFPIKQDQTSFGLSLMKWGGGLVLTTDILSRFSVGSSKIAVHVVLDNKQRGKIAIRTGNSDKIPSAGIIGILSIAVSVFGFFRSRFSVQNSR